MYKTLNIFLLLYTFCPLVDGGITFLTRKAQADDTKTVGAKKVFQFFNVVGFGSEL